MSATDDESDAEFDADPDSEFEQLRHRPPAPLDRPREIVVACAPMRSNVNLSNILRTVGCCGVTRFICCGNAKIIGKVARDAASTVAVEIHRTLPPALKRLREEGYRLVGLEQTTNSHNLHAFAFERKTALVIGNERLGISEEVLKMLDAAVEIPVWGLPYAYNVATATAMALYEYCRQFPRG